MIGPVNMLMWNWKIEKGSKWSGFIGMGLAKFFLGSRSNYFRSTSYHLWVITAIVSWINRFNKILIELVWVIVVVQL